MNTDSLDSVLITGVRQSTARQGFGVTQRGTVNEPLAAIGKDMI